jgi:hypothetical protein
MFEWFIYLLAGLGLAVLVVALSPVILGRMIFPKTTLRLFTRFGHLASGLFNRISPELDLRLLVKATNRLFRKKYLATPYERRILFIPFCLRPLDCPADAEPEKGLICDSQCEGCMVGQVRQEALDLGYAEVYVIPSSRIMRNRGLLHSDQFMKKKIREHAPGAAVGTTCGWHLRNRILKKHTVDRKGYSDGKDKPRSVVQGMLLNGRNCKKAEVDWDKFRELIRMTPQDGRPEDDSKELS